MQIIISADGVKLWKHNNQGLGKSLALLLY